MEGESERGRWGGREEEEEEEGGRGSGRGGEGMREGKRGKERERRSDKKIGREKEGGSTRPLLYDFIIIHDTHYYYSLFSFITD